MLRTIFQTPQTRENFISQCPYNDADKYIHGFQATHQPAIWMGESGQVVLSPGVGDIEPSFTRRAHAFAKDDEVSTPYVYEVTFDAKTVQADANLTESISSPVPGGEQPVPDDVAQGANGRSRRDAQSLNPATAQAIPAEQIIKQRATADVNGTIKAAMTAASHVGFLRLDFSDVNTSSLKPYVFLQATRQNWTGHVHIDADSREISGSNPQRQDYALGPSRAPGFSGYFVSRFSHPFASYGVAHGDEIQEDVATSEGEHLKAYVKFDSDEKVVEVRTGVSFVSVEQARRNLDLEGPASVTFEETIDRLKNAWLGKIGRVSIEGFNKTDREHDPRTILYTSLFHALQYPNDFSEPLTPDEHGPRTLYSGYTDSVHQSNDSYYQSWSIWDTFRAEHSLLTMLAPERVNSMMRSLLQIYGWAGRLPMWANMIETNIMIGTHVDGVIANALERGFTQFDVAKAWEAVKKNAYEPPIDDTKLLYYDREGYTPDEVRAGLTTYLEKGYVPNDQWAESASRTLDYAFDDYAAAIVAQHAGDVDTAAALMHRALNNYKNIYNPSTTFMEAKNANGTWAGREQGWTEGDDWIYTFNVPHDVHGLAALLGGREAMKAKLDEYFEGGYNEHSNEPSHHAPYLYAVIGYPASTQALVREIAWENYNATAAGLSGNEGERSQLSSTTLDRRTFADSAHRSGPNVCLVLLLRPGVLPRQPRW